MPAEVTWHTGERHPFLKGQCSVWPCSAWTPRSALRSGMKTGKKNNVKSLCVDTDRSTYTDLFLEPSLL